MTTADTSYYQGDDEIASVRVSGDQIVSYGVTADNPAFREVMRVLKFVANSTTLSSSDISNAENLPEKRLDDRSTVQAKLATPTRRSNRPSRCRSITRAMPRLSDANLTGVDVAAVTAQLSTYQAQLTASFSALAKIQSLNLASYLR